MADEQYVLLPRCVVQEVLIDGTCPLHIRLQLQRALNGQLARKASPMEACDYIAKPLTSCGADDTNPSGDHAIALSFAAKVAAFLPYHDVLNMRTASAPMLCDVMDRQPVDEAIVSRSIEIAKNLQSGDTEQVEQAPAIDANKDVLTLIHDRICTRLWLLRLSFVTAGTSDESIFDAKIRSFVDFALRRRLEADFSAAKTEMENEVREAKLSMLQCVQVVSEEVDRRVRDNVLALQQEFDRRTQEQARGLQGMVERRVTEQAAILQAEVDRRTECVRLAMEQCAREQEAAAAHLRSEVAHTRVMMEERFREQEDSSRRVVSELLYLRTQFGELEKIRDYLEGRVVELELMALRLQQKLNAAYSARYGVWQTMRGCFPTWPSSRDTAS